MLGKAGNFNMGMSTRSQAAAGMGFAARQSALLTSSPVKVAAPTVTRNPTTATTSFMSPNAPVTTYGRAPQYGTPAPSATLMQNYQDFGNEPFTGFASRVKPQTTAGVHRFTTFSSPLYAGNDALDASSAAGTLKASTTFAQTLQAMRQRMGTVRQRVGGVFNDVHQHHSTLPMLKY